MAGEIKSYETQQVQYGEKNKLIGVKPIQVLLWQLTDRKGVVQTELGVEIEPGRILRFPTDLIKQSLPVNDRLQRLLFERLHPERAQANSGGPKAAPPGRLPKEEAAERLPKDVPIAEDGL